MEGNVAINIKVENLFLEWTYFVPGADNIARGGGTISFGE